MNSQFPVNEHLDIVESHLPPRLITRELGYSIVIAVLVQLGQAFLAGFCYSRISLSRLTTVRRLLAGSTAEIQLTGFGVGYSLDAVFISGQICSEVCRGDFIRRWHGLATHCGSCSAWLKGSKVAVQIYRTQAMLLAQCKGGSREIGYLPSRTVENRERRARDFRGTMRSQCLVDRARVVQCTNNAKVQGRCANGTCSADIGLRI